MKNKKAFTLIELLVVIAVIAGLMAMLVPNYMLARMKSRDVRRKSDLKSIQKALELYKLNQSKPTYPPKAALVSCAALSDSNGVYMQTVPQDPLGSCPTVTSSYNYEPVLNGTTGNYETYTLTSCLENTADPEKVNCPGTITCNPSTSCYQLKQP